MLVYFWAEKGILSYYNEINVVNGNMISSRSFNLSTSSGSTLVAVNKIKDCQDRSQKKTPYKNKQDMLVNRNIRLKTVYKTLTAKKLIPDLVSTALYVQSVRRYHKINQENRALLEKIKNIKSTIPSHVCRY